MTRDDLGPTFSLDLLYGVVTFAGVGLAFLALDDITTDAASAFLVERAALAGCALWFTVAAWRLLRQGHQVLGGLSLGVVAALVLAQVRLRACGGSMWRALAVSYGSS